MEGEHGFSAFGRTDLPAPEKAGENAGILYDAIHRKIAPLGVALFVPLLVLGLFVMARLAA